MSPAERAVIIHRFSTLGPHSLSIFLNYFIWALFNGVSTISLCYFVFNNSSVLRVIDFGTPRLVRALKTPKRKTPFSALNLRWLSIFFNFSTRALFNNVFSTLLYLLGLVIKNCLLVMNCVVFLSCKRGHVALQQNPLVLSNYNLIKPFSKVLFYELCWRYNEAPKKTLWNVPAVSVD